MTDSTTTSADNVQRISMLKVLNPFHVWALGGGIVLVGEFMGWHFSVAKVLLGSIAEQVISKAHCPVTVVR
jgi:hypothetical protein